jgi:hypothetical protein
LPTLPSLTLPPGPTPIPSVALGSPPSYEGAPADPQPVRGAGAVPWNPFMAPNGESEIHDDGWQTDAFAWTGPLGRSPQTLSSYLAPGRDCGSIAFDSHGRVVSICISTSGPELYMFDPSTLATPATFSLPLRTPEDLLLNPNVFQDFSNGGYFYLNNGQVDDRTGSTPTVMPGGFVNITDNADPMDVMVYRTQIHVRRRQVCRVPVFDAGASANENSLIGAGRSMIVEDNYGYQSPASVEGGQVTAAGFARVDLNHSGTGCRLVWANRTERAPTVVSKLSTADGLIYTYTKDPGSSDPWYWTTIDFRTGRTVYKQLAGTGVGYNNNYSGIAISPAGTEYVGTLGGIIALRDG